MREHVRHDDYDSFLGLTRRELAEHRSRARADMMWLFVAVIVWFIMTVVLSVAE